MTSDIVEKLRAIKKLPLELHKLTREAADLIERQAARDKYCDEAFRYYEAEIEDNDAECDRAFRAGVVAGREKAQAEIERQAAEIKEYDEANRDIMATKDTFVAKWKEAQAEIERQAAEIERLRHIISRQEQQSDDPAKT